jgi:hypothetical protein
MEVQVSMGSTEVSEVAASEILGMFVCGPRRIYGAEGQARERGGCGGPRADGGRGRGGWEQRQRRRVSVM